MEETYTTNILVYDKCDLFSLDLYLQTLLKVLRRAATHCISIDHLYIFEIGFVKAIRTSVPTKNTPGRVKTSMVDV